MFSLIITVIAIALVAVLALATLYYGGVAFGKGASRAEASKILNQGQQLMGAADLYFNDHRAWPATINNLVSEGYLKQIPTAQASGLMEAIAAGTTWAMVPNTPTFYTATQALDVCAEVNLSGSLKQRGVLKHAYTKLVAQCYGDASLTTVFKKASDTPLNDGTPGGGIPDADIGGGDPPTDPTDPDWNVKPGDPIVPGGGAGAVAWTARWALTPVVGESYPLGYTITNNGSQPVTLVSVSSSNTPTWTAGLAYIPNGGGVLPTSCADHLTLTAGETCYMTVVYAPTAPGASTTTLTLNYTGAGDSGTKTMTASATATGGSNPPGPCAWPSYCGPTDGDYPLDPGLDNGGWHANVSALNYGDTLVGQYLKGVITLTNNTGADASLYSYEMRALDFFRPTGSWRDPLPLPADWSCFDTVPNGGTCTLEVYFTPHVDGLTTGKFIIQPVYGGSQDMTISLSGTGIDTSAGTPPTGTLILDRFNGTPNVPVNSRMTDTNNNWYTGFWQNDFVWNCDWTVLSNGCTGLILDGQGNAVPGMLPDDYQGTIMDQVADYHMPVRNYYVDLDVISTSRLDAEDAYFGIYGRMQETPDPKWDNANVFVDLTWQPIGYYAGVETEGTFGRGIGYVPAELQARMPNAAPGNHTLRGVFFDDMAFVFVDGVPKAAYNITGGDAGYVGFTMWQRYWDENGVAQNVVKAREFRAGTLDPYWTREYAENLFSTIRANLPPPPTPPAPQMCTYPVYAKVHLTGGYQPNRLGRDQFLDPPGWYDFNGTPTYYPHGWAYMWGAQIGTRQARCQ